VIVTTLGGFVPPVGLDPGCGFPRGRGIDESATIVDSPLWTASTAGRARTITGRGTADQLVSRRASAERAVSVSRILKPLRINAAQA
jgi:hypothetical protein